ncbi:MAG TPA: 16S rRNA (cytidine(1402)-2'-O)-methyltransferase [Candidatus Kerfeldbacteria bacterium]|nr:16S rRNA (cytidine(1402)-2'-O)-methyltransferase [Candidatus Kerfeldbacteria bacterium]
MGTLYTVATPIGNLADVTYRAIQTLREVDLILCEDTRVTKRLLDHYQITTPTRPYHQHTQKSFDHTLINQLLGGKNIAVVTDAGTPGISDPGNRLVLAAIAVGINVVPIPGPSAVIATLQAAGVDTSQFMFYGFLPHKKGRQTLLKEIAEANQTVVFYESIHRIQKTIQALADSGKYIVVARELTKTFEEFIRGDAKTVAQRIATHPTLKGECVVVVSVGDTATPRLHASE